MSIVVNVPFIKPHDRFLPHFIEWYAYNKDRHQLRLNWQMYKALHQVQAKAVQYARRINATHILFTEDDQWGFPIDGLEVLLEADKDVIGFPTYSRKFPYAPFNMRKKDPAVSLITRSKNLTGFAQGSGPEVQPTDLLSWAFMLVKTDVFDRIQDPFEIWGICPTDSYFCQYCADAGIDVHVHFGYVMPHGDFGPNEVLMRRRMGDALRAQQRQRADLEPILVSDEHGDFEYTPEALQVMQDLAEAPCES